MATVATMVSSAGGLLAMLNEPHPVLKLHALSNLNHYVDYFWPEISTSVPTILQEFSGDVGLADSVELESDMSTVPLRTVEILASCHALVFVDSKLVGDPLQKAALKGIDWAYKSDEKAMPKKGGGQAVQIVQRHHFASHLK